MRAYVDRGYPGAQKMYEGVEVLAPIRKKPGKKLTDAEKASNKAHSRIRVYVEHAIRKVKTWRIMGDRYRNPLKKVRPDQRCRLRAGKPKAAVAGRTGSLTEMGLKSRANRLGNNNGSGLGTSPASG